MAEKSVTGKKVDVWDALDNNRIFAANSTWDWLVKVAKDAGQDGYVRKNAVHLLAENGQVAEIKKLQDVTDPEISGFARDLAPGAAKRARELREKRENEIRRIYGEELPRGPTFRIG